MSKALFIITATFVVYSAQAFVGGGSRAGGLYNNEVGSVYQKPEFDTSRDTLEVRHRPGESRETWSPTARTAKKKRSFWQW